MAWFEDENGNTIMADMVNTGDDPKALKDCIVGAISVDDYDLEEGGLTVLFPAELRLERKKRTFLQLTANRRIRIKMKNMEILITGMTKKVTTTHVQLKQMQKRVLSKILPCSVMNKDFER